MRQTVSIYDPATGLFTGRTFCGSAEFVAMNIPEGMAAVEGRFDRLTQRVDLETGAVVAYERPAAELEAEQRAAQAERARHRIEALERSQARPMRELLVDPNNATAKQRLAEIDGEIAGLRGELSR